MSPHRPLVTVIVPNYNYAAVLPLCLAAVQAQTYSPLEILVVDDGSTDDSVRVARSMGVAVVSTACNSGPAVARSTGAARAGGEILFFVDSDVALAPDAVANAVALLGADPRLGAVCGVYDPEPLLHDSAAQEYRALQHHYWTVSSAGDVSFLWSAIFAIRAAVYAEIGPFNSRLRYTEEVDYGHRLGQRYALRSTPAIHGRSDHDDLPTLLRKLFHRCRLRVPLYATRRRFAQGYETSSRALGVLAALLAVLTLPLPALFGPMWTFVPAGAAVAWLACDAGLYRFVFRRRGPAFTALFVGLHFLVSVVIASAVVAGAAQWLVSRRFRRYYAEPVPPGSAPPGSVPAGGGRT